MSECLLSGDIVYEQGSNGASVVGACDGSEVLLSCSIPDLKFDIFIFDGNSFGTEFYSDGNIMGSSGFSLNKLENDAWFSDSSVSDNDEFEEIVIGIHY